MFESISIVKDYLNTNFIREFEIEVSMGKWESVLSYDHCWGIFFSKVFPKK
jgi:hypothetical protein